LSVRSERTPSRQELRRELRARRRSLSPRQQRQAARSLCHQLQRHPRIRNARHIALYWPNDGEIDPRPFLEYARHHGNKCFYLPVLHPIHHNRLWFCRISKNTPLESNRFGIPEPRVRRHQRRAPWTLDAVLMPLVGFSADGGRLGMGGGFYDRTFAFTRHRSCAKPALIGLAHELQRVTALQQAHWDIPMDTVVTDKGIYGKGRR